MTDEALVPAEPGGIAPSELLMGLAERWRLLVTVPLLVAAATFGLSYLLAPTFKARTAFLPPQQQQSSAASALASLGGLAAAAGGAAGLRNPVDQYVSLMQSETVQDRLIDRFKLLDVYEVKLRRDARRKLSGYSQMSAGKKDNIIVIEVEDTNPQRAAAIANEYVEELRRMTSTLAVTEAQQRRQFFEGHLKKARDDLTAAQQQLQGSGFDAGAFKAEPKAAAEEYGRAKAEVIAAEVRLQAVQGRLTANTPEVRQAQAAVDTLRLELSRLERTQAGGRGPDYISRFRDFKYQETLFEMFARQYELARLDESREGSLIQVIDPATVPEWKSSPKRLQLALMAGAASLVLLAAWLAIGRLWVEGSRSPQTAQRQQRLLAAMGLRRNHDRAAASR